jgi:hypothetical protein
MAMGYVFQTMQNSFGNNSLPSFDFWQQTIKPGVPFWNNFTSYPVDQTVVLAIWFVWFIN